MKELKKYASFFEALKLSDYKSALSKVSMPDEETLDVLRWAMGKLSQITGITKSRNGHRLYLPLKGGGKAASISPDFEKAIQDLVSKKGYSDPDIVSGTIKEPAHGRVVKFSKAFRDLSDKGLVDKALADYSESPYLYGKKGQNMLVFTAHPYDKIGASTGRDWNSCTTIYRSVVGDTLSKLVKGTNILVYWTDIGDTNLNEPKGRAVLSVYERSSDGENKLYIWPENKVYGNFPVLAMDFLQNALVEIFPDVTDFLSVNRTDRSNYDGMLNSGEWLVKRDSFVLKGPFDWASASDRLRAYVSAKYNVEFDEKGEVSVGQFVFPIPGEPYFSDKLPFVFKNLGILVLNKCKITDYSGLPQNFQGILQIYGNKKLVNLDTVYSTLPIRLELVDVPAFTNIGRPTKNLDALMITNAPNFDISQDGQFDRMGYYMVEQTTPIVRDIFPKSAPNLTNIEIDIKDWEGMFVHTDFSERHIKEKFPLLYTVTFFDNHGQLTYVPDYFLSEGEYTFSIEGENSPYLKMCADLYNSTKDYIVTAVLNSRAVTKDIIYWDKLPEYIKDHRRIQRPVSGVFYGKKIV